MAGLNLDGTFVFTIGFGKGPELIAALSAAHDDGSPVDLEAGLSEEPRFFVVLSLGMGSTRLDLNVVSTKHLEAGFADYVLALNWAEVGGVQGIRITTIGVVVQTATDRGQTVMCGCTPTLPPSDDQ